MTKKDFAYFISALFHGPTIVGGSVLVLFLSPQLIQKQFELITLVICSIIVPLLVTIYLKQHKIISDWDITNRRERYFFFVGIIGSLLLQTLLLSYVHASGNLIKLSAIATILLTAYMLINYRWKISLHSAGITILALLYIQFLSAPWWILAIIPLIWWSRVTLKKHTLAQCIAGTLLAVLMGALW